MILCTWRVEEFGDDVGGYNGRFLQWCVEQENFGVIVMAVEGVGFGYVVVTL